MYIFNQVINFNASPGILFDSILTNEEAQQYPVGSVAFDQTTHSIYRNEGNPGSQSWVNYSSGGGLSNLQSVLDNGHEADNQIIILVNTTTFAESTLDYDNLYLYKNDDKDIYLTQNYERLAIVTDNSVITLGSNYISALDNINSYTISINNI
jgi:hypothetical protein